MFARIARGLARAGMIALGVVVGLALSLSWLTGHDAIEPTSWRVQLPPAPASLERVEISLNRGIPKSVGV